MRFSPDGSRLLLWVGPGPRLGAGFYEIAMPDGEPRLVLRGLGNRSGLIPALFSWLPDNRHVVLTRSDGASLQPRNCAAESGRSLEEEVYAQ